MQIPVRSRRQFLKALGIGAVSLTVPGCMTVLGRSSHDRRSTRKPNIVFILADDMGYGDLACQNPDSKVPTPNLDKLAREGIRFTDAHSPSAVCTPTRYGVLTGRYCWRTRLKTGVFRPWDPPLIDKDRLTVGSFLKQHGYHTACIGKWHLGWDWPSKDGKPVKAGWSKPGWNADFTRPVANGPTTRGFDYYFGTDVPNFPPYCFIENDRTVGIPTVKKPDSMFGSSGLMLEGWDLRQILPGLQKKAVEYINERAGAGTPFFLYFPLTAPHTPIAPAQAFHRKSQAGAYGDFVHQVDAVVGSVMDALKRNDLTENTLVIFTSDNGAPGRDGTNMNGAVNSVRRFGHNPSYIYRGIRADVWDGGHRVPFIARWPGRIRPRSVSAEPICHVDLMATCAAILGAELPDDAGQNSYDILPALLGRKLDKPIARAIVHHSGNGMFAIRRRKWKLILGRGSGGWSGKGKKTDPPVQLYNMQEDKSEKINLCSEHPEVVETLTKLLEKYRKQGRSRPLGKKV